jgi:glycosyltransferase involved in cell wall biosynthesis
MKATYSVAHISDQVFYWDGCTWYTAGGFPLAELVQSSSSAIDGWSFFGRLVTVEHPPDGVLAVSIPEGLDVSFIGPRLISRGILGYVRNLPEYFRQLRSCIKGHDVVWVKSNLVAAWFALPFLLGSGAFRVSHQIGDPAQIAVGPRLLIPIIRYFASGMTRLVHRFSDVNVFVSEQLRREYGSVSRESWVYNESRLRSEQIIDPGSLSEDLHRPVRLIYVGRFSPEKGIPVLLRALPKLHCDFELRLVGSGSQQGQLERLASELSVRDRVQFLGAMAWGDALFDVMRNSDILILPSHTEGLGLVLLEAMSQGLPVVASDVGGIPEIVVHEVTGLLFPVGDADALAALLSRLIGDKGLRTRVRKTALEVARLNTIDRQLGKMFGRLFARQERATGLDRGFISLMINRHADGGVFQDEDHVSSKSG